MGDVVLGGTVVGDVVLGGAVLDTVIDIPASKSDADSVSVSVSDVEITVGSDRGGISGEGMVDMRKEFVLL